jgi:hypothetical protein
LSDLFYSFSYLSVSSLNVDTGSLERLNDPTNLDEVPEALAAEPHDAVEQSTILTGILGSSRYEDTSEERFHGMPVNSISLSTLKRIYEKKDRNAANLLSVRHSVRIDDDFQIPLGSGRVNVNTDETMIDYLLTVAKGVGFASLLPNSHSCHRFMFKMNLKAPAFPFKGKHAMLGFDPTGCMLYIGQSANEDVFLAMAPNEFLRGHVLPSPLSRSSGSSLMSKRHYRQVVMMIVHFLHLMPELSYDGPGKVYRQDLDSPRANFSMITNVLYVFAKSTCSISISISISISFSNLDLVADRPFSFHTPSDHQVVRLNFETLSHLDSLLVGHYDEWVADAPAAWKLDGFLKNNSPIIVTSRFGQNARVAVPGNEEEEANAWQLERDHSKLAFITIALATSIK